MSSTDKLKLEIMQTIQKRFDELSDKIDKLDEKLVSRKEFEPVRNLVYGGVGLILTSVFIALISLIIKK